MFPVLLGGMGIRNAEAHVIDRIEINRVGDEAEIQVFFDVKIQYLREASLDNGEVRLYFNMLEPDPDRDRLVPEGMNPPPADFAPHFTVTYPAFDSSLAIKFDNPVSYRVNPGSDGRSISIFTPVIKPEENQQAGEASAMIERTQDEIEAEAKRYIDSARDAMQHNQLEAAIETLNRLLLLPPNRQAQDAQELVGDARAMNGEYEKARAEYETYLQLYPDAADLQQVREKMAKLSAEPARPVQQAPRPGFVEEKMTVYGGLSQYYYKGVSHTDAFSIASDLTTTTSSVTGTDQDQLISQFDITGRKRTESTDTRLVFRESYNANFLPGQGNENRFNDAFVEQSARDRRYMYRIGRQTGSGGGVPGRFDGVLAGYSLNPTWRINGVYGTPVEFVIGGASPGPVKTIAGVSADLTRLPEQWSGTGYFIQQLVQGYVDRRAVGMEAHYFDVRKNYMVLFEYDTLFRKVNLGMFQGNWTQADGTTYNMLVDHRRSPPLQLTNALMGQPVQSIPALLVSGSKLSTLRADALALSPISNMFAIGMSRPYSSTLRLGGDFRINNMTGTGATSFGQPASAGSGNTYTYSFNALGNDLFFENDLGVVNVAYISAPTYKGRNLAFTQVETFRQHWRVDMLLQLYSQNDTLGVSQTQVRPSLKLNYRVSNSVNLEGEGGIELMHTSSATQNDKTRRRYFYVGYRWDFQ